MKQSLLQKPGPTGVFDSGCGGLAIPNKIRGTLPDYDYIYLGDSARTPYGIRSFGIVYEPTLQAVNKPFEIGCHLVVLACNTASTKVLRTIQMNNLPDIDPSQRVLGVIRPTVEYIDSITQIRHIGVLAVAGTIRSESYSLEIRKLLPNIRVGGEACPMQVPLVENNETSGGGTDFFIRKYIHDLLVKDGQIDTIILECTRYPLLLSKIQRFVPQSVEVVAQGGYVVASLRGYLYKHPEIDRKYTRGGSCNFCAIEAEDGFIESASTLPSRDITIQRISLE